MKKSKIVNLVLITSALASCHQKQDKWSTSNKKHVYMRGDSTAKYNRTHGGGNSLLWYYAFRPYGFYNNGIYHRSGYYNGAIPASSNFGNNSFKMNSATHRGGFGGQSSRGSSTFS